MEKNNKEIKEEVLGAKIKAYVSERFHFFMDINTKPKEITKLLEEIKRSNDKASYTGENLDEQISKAHDSFNIAYTPKSLVGLRIESDKGTVNIWPRKSFLWEIDVCGECGQEKRNLVETIKRRVKSESRYQDIQEKIFSDFDRKITLTAAVLEIFESDFNFDELIEAFKNDMHLIPDKLGLPKGHISASLINYDSLVVIIHTVTETKDMTPEFFVLVFHRNEKQHMACTGEIDYVYDILQLISCAKLLRIEEEQITILENDLLGKIDEVMIILQDEDQKKRNDRLKSILVNLVNMRRQIIQTDRDIGDILKYKESLVDKLSVLEDQHLKNSAFGTAMFIVKDVERDIELLNKNLSENIKAIRNIISENLRSDTVAGVNKTYHELRREVAIERDMDNAIQGMHAMHSAIFILEFLLFSEFFMMITEHLVDLEHLETQTKLMFIFGSLVAGIVSALSLTYIARKTNLAKKIFKPKYLEEEK